MKTEYQIYMDYKKTLQQAEHLARIGKELTRAADQTAAGILSASGSAWKGEAAGRFRLKGKNLQKKIRRSGTELCGAADVIRRTAANLYRAEMQALEIARTRNEG